MRASSRALFLAGGVHLWTLSAVADDSAVDSTVDSVPAADSDPASDSAGDPDSDPAGDPTLEDVDMEALFEGPVEAATAEVETPPTEATRREIEGEELTTMPGTRGDALRAIEVLPGVARVPFAGNDGPPPLRGSGPFESRVLLDGVPVPLLYHFGGLTSFFNSHLLESVELLPGNHSTRFGRSSAGIVDAHVRSEHPEDLRAALELSLLDNQAWVEAPLGEETSVAVAARRSNIDLVFSTLVPEDTLSATAAPVYYDYQALVRHRLSRSTRVQLLGYGSRDHMKLLFANPNQDDPALYGQVEGRLEFHRLQGHVHSDFGSVQQRLTVSAGPRVMLQKLGDLRARLDSVDLYGRADWSVHAHERLRADFGLDVETEFFSGTYSGPMPSVDGDLDNEGPLGTLEMATVTRSIEIVRPGGYAELSYRPHDDVLLVPGVRTDFQYEAERWSVDPRLAARWQATPQFVAKAAVGSFTRPVDYYLLIPEIGNPHVAPERTVQGSVGFEADPDPRLHLDFDAFAKYWPNRIVSTPGGAPPRFRNAGHGRAHGFEVLLRAQPTAELMTLVAYTLSRSQREDGDGSWRIYEGDQTHNLSLVTTYDLGAGWQLGGRFRYVTGNPDTPIVGSVYAAELDQYRPVHGAFGSRRLPAFHQLDVRIDKRWELGPVALTTYLEVLNAYNAQNQEGVTYSYDYATSEPVTGLPIFPNLGVRGEL